MRNSWEECVAACVSGLGLLAHDQEKGLASGQRTEIKNVQLTTNECRRSGIETSVGASGENRECGV